MTLLLQKCIRVELRKDPIFNASSSLEIFLSVLESVIYPFKGNLILLDFHLVDVQTTCYQRNSSMRNQLMSVFCQSLREFTLTALSCNSYCIIIVATRWQKIANALKMTGR
ncbi:hypothetical protein FOB22_000246 [Saccharomyces cerevisiae]|nr:hypothetical protein FOB22_000246 [Saccharomyces cerevisiae]